MDHPDVSVRCQRCGAQMDLRDPGPDDPWPPQQFWECPDCNRHFWTTYPALKPAKPKPAADGAKPAPAAKPAAATAAPPAAAPKTDGPPPAAPTPATDKAADTGAQG